MRLLVLGGTVFVGRAVVEEALARGHEVTLFNRGSRDDLFPQLERLRGDREGDLSALAGREWDAVVDPSGFAPADVRRSADLLGPRVEHYTFVSSVSVYADELRPLRAETTPTLPGSDGYGALKARCEEAAEAALPGRVLHVRPGLVVGPRDPTDRFTYWPRRVAAGGEVLAPGRPERPVQLVDVRDLAGWIVTMVERREVGVFNAVGPAEPLTMRELLEACRRATGSDARFTWVGDEPLLAAGIEPYTELPLWVPAPHPHSFDAARAVAAGLRFRPLAETIRDTLEWARREAPPATDRPIRATTLAPERERELLQLAAAAR